jgi:choline dehydrogenase-like flavoprotein
MAGMRIFSLAFAALLTSAGVSAASHSFDVVVYGGTAGGVIAAVGAAREGLKAALLEPGAHLGFTDYGKKDVIGGYALEFYLRTGRHYQLAQYAQKIAWLHEPSVAEAIFNGMARDAGVTVFLHTRLREHGGVTKNGSRIASGTGEQHEYYAAYKSTSVEIGSRHIEPIA